MKKQTVSEIDLNRLLIPEAEGTGRPLEDFSCTSNSIEVIFRNFEVRLTAEISKAKVVLGCVAWLTHFPFLEALSEIDSILVVQKEDFLRPDTSNNFKSWKTKLRLAYNKLSCRFTRYDLPGIGGELSTSSDPTVTPVRCVGNHNSLKLPAFPRMHNKFLVFCDVDVDNSIGKGVFGHERIVPKKVWTGSFNLTGNATRSFENALIVSDPLIATAYANEFAQIFALSEPLDWESSWAAPEFRIGT